MRIAIYLSFLCSLQVFADDTPSAPTPAKSTKSAVMLETPAVATRGDNLAGQADTSRGEGRRNENVQVNLVDTNAARELNTRVGVTATIIEEFHSDRGYFSAEYGNSVINPVHVTVQRGNGIHGTVFWDHGNSIFSARSFFQVGAVQPARRNEYGGAGAAELWKGAYVTLSASQDKNRGQVNGNVLIPLPSERTPLATDPAVRALVIRYMSAYPNVSPNRPDIAARALNTNSPQSTDTNFGTGQLTQTLNSRDSLAMRYSFIGQKVQAFQLTQGQNPNTDNKSHSARITWNRVYGRDAIDVSASFDRQGVLLLPSGDAVGPISVSGLTGLGPPSIAPLDRAIDRYRLQSTWQHSRGNHSFLAGGGTTRQHYNGYETEDSRPTFLFRDDFGRTAIENLRWGTSSIYSQSFGFYDRSFRNSEVQAFAGERWSVNQRLTVNAGVRWEPWTKPQDAMKISKLPFGSDWNNVGGNFGFSYRLPYGVIRSAVAVIMGQLYPITYGQDRLNPPYNFSVAIVSPDLVNPLKGLSAADLNGSGRAVRFDIDPNLATPYSYQYNFSWEGALRGGWKAQLGYVGSRTHKLFVTYQLNRGRYVPSIPFTTATTNLRRADQNFYQKFYTLNGSRAYYDAGRATLSSPRWRGGQFTASYWYSKAIDLGADYAVTGGGQERWGQAGQTEAGFQHDMKGLSNFDQPHAFLLQGTWNSGGGVKWRAKWLRELSRRWMVTSILLLKSGTPFTLDSGSDSPGFGNVDGTSGDRINVVDPSVLGRTIGNPETSQLLLPHSAFAFFQAPQQTAGNIGRNTFRKGKIANWNASLARSWALPGDWTMTLAAEAVNLSNTPQFAEPGKSLSSTNFGQINNTLNDGRTFRFSLRLLL